VIWEVWVHLCITFPLTLHRTGTSNLREVILKTCGQTRPDLYFDLEAVEHHLPLGLVLPEVPKEPFLFGVVLADPLQAALDEPLVGGKITLGSLGAV
jgi:hypothetical protein